MAIANITGNILTDSGIATSSLLPLSGGTLTGPLSGTSATFSGNIAVGSTFSAWGSPFAITQYPYGSYSGGTTSGAWVGGNNNYYDGSVYKYALSDYATLLTQGGGDFYIRTAPSGIAGNTITWTERFRVTNTGNVGIGTSSPGSLLTLFDSSTPKIAFQNSGAIRAAIQADSSSLILNSVTGNDIRFQCDSAERMRITSGGSVLIGTTTDSAKLTAIQSGSSNGAYIENNGGSGYGLQVNISTNSGSQFIMKARSTGVDRFIVRDDGAVFAPGIYNFTTGSGANVVVFSDGSMQRSTSSLKYKKNVENYTKGLAEVMQMRSVTYNSKNENETQTFAGLIAEEIHDLGLTEFVQYAEDGSPDALSYSNMVSILVKAIQEQQAQIEELRQIVATK
jgi:hypothetical protein